MDTIRTVDELFAVLASGGGELYFGEPVTVLEHCLQAAAFTREHGGGDELVAAALLHDLGHLLHTDGEDAARRGLDTRHEDLAAEVLAEHLPAAVVDPIRMHVAAKRYLCHADGDYLGKLSPASVESLALQGGPMSESEAEAFVELAHSREAVALRHADDAAKVLGLQVPDLESYRPLIERFWR